MTPTPNHPSRQCLRRAAVSALLCSLAFAAAANAQNSGSASATGLPSGTGGTSSTSATPAKVEVRAVAAPAAVRYDVQNLCPHLLEQVPEALAKLHAERGEVAVVEVAFALNAGRVGEVKALGGSAAYQRALKRLVRQASCSNEAQTANAPALAQDLRFRVQFVDPATARALAGASGSRGAATVLMLGAASAPASGTR